MSREKSNSAGYCRTTTATLVVMKKNFAGEEQQCRQSATMIAVAIAAICAAAKP